MIAEAGKSIPGKVMTKILIFSDIHNDARALEKLMSIEADAYICAGDLVSWARGLEKMAPLLKPRAERVYVMPGNHESERDIADFCARHGFINFHGATIELGGGELGGGELGGQFGGVRFAGLGYSTPTPFDTPGEYSEAEMAARLEKFAPWNPHVLICHAPPLDTALDRIKEGLHAGSRAVREFIEKHQPSHFFCGHVHEAEGVVIQMGATRAMNVGKKGYLLEI
ncbi:MAG TPA: metallophosphoesterase [Bryobacteraceae bacterium]|nr:metallophosphoesterase [Bryobacteraceae bacterium]